LRAAIQQSNSLTSCGTIDINFSGVTGSIDLGTFLPQINHNVNINGPGADVLTVQRGASAAPVGIFWINSNIKVTMSGITIKNGFAQMGQGGGGIHNEGTLVLLNSTVTGNQSIGSGGGGIVNGNGFNLTLAAMTIVNSTISGNQTVGSGSLNTRGGGGVFNSGVGLTIINSTISGNKTGDFISGSIQPDGGGIENWVGNVFLVNTTITGNQTGAGGRGGGVSTEPANAATTKVRNTIIANNTNAGSNSGPDFFGTLTSEDYNLITILSGGTLAGTTTHNIANVNPLLGALAFNGGRTMTHALLVGSPAINAGNNVFAVDQNGSALTSDQRGSGFPRIFNGIVDIGAYEVVNPIDEASFFVKQHYLDFLNRQPDQSGWDFWTNQIISCGASAQCTEVRRIDVSASFFLSIEFQNNGYLVERFYKVAYGEAPGSSTFGGAHQLSVPNVRFNEFNQGTQRIGQGVIVLAAGWEQLLESNKQAYALEFVQTARFITAFPTSMTPAQFVDQLNERAGNVLSAGERTTAINLFSGAADSSNTTFRAQALRKVAEDPDLYNSEYNRAFVLAQYFGYLRRNPNDAPDSDYTGYDFWLTKLNQFNGNYINAEMVKAFLSSIEYRQRFGP